MRYAVIMAGGSGKRLWPASRQDKPKQLIRLVDGKALLEVAVGRLEGMFDPAHILIVTNQAYSAQVSAMLPTLPPENIIGEPQGRDTANAIALAAEIIAARNPRAAMAVFTADHIIRPEEEFLACIEQAFAAAERDDKALVTFGIRPTYPNTGLGYVHCGEKDANGIRPVVDFKEKPDHHTARHYVESGEYFWNSGMFVWQVQTILGALRRLLPASAEALAPVGQAAKAGRDFTALLAKVYPTLPKISIDYAIMEKAGHVLMVELTCQWLDVGSWPALADVAALDSQGNAILAARAAMLDSNANVIYSDDDHLVAVVGMDNCIVVHTADATLVCNKSDSQRLRELVDWVGKHYGSEYV
jgi:mannose-1-phosphate guanylyltransferase